MSVKAVRVKDIMGVMEEIAPKKLAENWNPYKDNYVNNPIASDRLNYDVLFHTDLSRARGEKNSGGTGCD